MSAIASTAVPTRAERSVWVLSGGLTAVAWLLLLAWARSPWAHLLDHEGTEGLAPSLALIVFITTWTLMLVAMMLPTTMPLLRMFTRVVSGRSDGARLRATLLAGYGVVWLLAGCIAYACDEAVHALDDQWSVVGSGGWVLVAGAIAAAGAYQYSSFKDRCLTRCRTPAGVIVAAWRGNQPTAEAFRIGTSHGWSCVGCCWALMLIMFALGAANLVLLVALTTVMTAEKVAPWGASVTRPVGIVLLAVAAGITVVHL